MQMPPDIAQLAEEVVASLAAKGLTIATAESCTGGLVAGALTYAMADFGLIKRQPGVSEKAHCEKAAQHLIKFAQAGLKA